MNKILVSKLLDGSYVVGELSDIDCDLLMNVVGLKIVETDLYTDVELVPVAYPFVPDCNINIKLKNVLFCFPADEKITENYLKYCEAYHDS